MTDEIDPKAEKFVSRLLEDLQEEREVTEIIRLASNAITAQQAFFTRVIGRLLKDRTTSPPEFQVRDELRKAAEHAASKPKGPSLERRVFELVQAWIPAPIRTMAEHVGGTGIHNLASELASVDEFVKQTNQLPKQRHRRDVANRAIAALEDLRTAGSNTRTPGHAKLIAAIEALKRKRARELNHKFHEAITREKVIGG